VVGDRHMPKFLIGDSVKYIMNMRVLGKIEALKKFVHLFTVVSIGEIKGD
jgi:hypothetical protein